MKKIQWKWIFTGSKTCSTIWRPFWFAMEVILNPKWPPKYKNPPIWAKFGFQVDYNVANWYPLFGSNVMILQIISYLVILIIIIIILSFFCQKCVRHISRRLLNGNQWSLTGMLSTMSRCADYFRNFQNGRRCHGNHKKKHKIFQSALNWMILTRIFVWHVHT